MKDLILAQIHAHIGQSHAYVAIMAAVLANFDRLATFALRFIPKETIEAELDRINAAAKARIEKDASPVVAPIQVPPKP